MPMKPLALAKTRLSGEDLSHSQRRALTCNLLVRVLRAVAEAVQSAPTVEDTWVVGGDPHIRRAAEAEGATWYEEEGSDINETLCRAFGRAFQRGKAALFLPGDLPFLKARDVLSMAGASKHLRNVTLAPARQGGGTNGLLVPPGLPHPFPTLLGPDSFRRHLSQAASLGLSVAICYSPGLACDLDTFEDLRVYEHVEPGLLKKLSRGRPERSGGE